MMPPPPPPPQDAHTMEANGPNHNMKPESATFVIVMNVTNTITHLLLGGVAFGTFFYVNLFQSSSFSQHIYLCVTGYVIMMSQAILAFNRHAGWTSNFKHPNKSVIHWVMQVSGAILAITGSVIAISENSPNFQSTHGILGLVAMVLTILSLIGGAMHLVLPKRMTTMLYRTLHACIGCVTITTAFIALCCAYHEYYRVGVGDLNANFSIALAVAALIGMLSSPFTNLVRRCSRR